MPNVVRTIFEGDATQYFATADAVAARNRSFESPAVGAQAPLVQQQKLLTAAVVSETEKQAVAERAATKTIVEETQKRIAATKAEADAITISRHRSEFDQRPLIGPQPVAFSPSNPSPFGIQPGSASDTGFYRRILQQETADRISNIKQQETGFANYFKKVAELRTADLVETKLVNAAETADTVKAAEKQAIARRSSIVGRENLSIPIGGGLTSRIGLTGGAGLAIGAGLAVGAIATDFAISAAQDYAKNLAEAESRTARLRVVSNDLSIAQKDLAGSIETVSTRLHITRGEAEAIVVPLADLASKTRKPIQDLQSDVIDLASARGIDKDALPSVLKNIAAGTADAAVFGRNASSVFDLYAASIGTTADKLDDLQKQQALANQLLRQGELNSGANASSVANQALQVDGLSKAWTKFKDTVGEGATPVLKGLLNSLTTSLGGTPDNGRFDFTRGGAAVVKDFSDDLEAQAKETKTRMDAFVKSFNDDKKLLQDAIANPNASIANKGLARIDLRQFLQQSPEQRQQIKQDAIANAKIVTDAQATAFQTALSNNGGNIAELSRLKQNIDVLKNVFEPETYKRLAEQAGRAIDVGFKSMIESAKNNVPRLRQIFQDVAKSPDLQFDQKSDLFRSITEQIKATVDAAKAKVKELSSAFQTAFDTVTARESSQNPFLKLLDDADKRTRQLREQTRGLRKDIQDALLARNAKQDNLELFNLRADTRLNAFNLRDQARQFRAGQLDDNNDPETIQRRLQQQLDALRPIRGFVNQIVGQVSGGNLPPGPIFKSVPVFDATTPEEKTAIDQKIIALTQGLNPAQLTPEENQVAAQAREDEAKRQLEAETQAAADRKEQIRLLTSIETFVLTLQKAAENGKIPVDLGDQPLFTIEVTSPKPGVTVTRSATAGKPKSTAQAMDPN